MNQPALKPEVRLTPEKAKHRIRRAVKACNLYKAWAASNAWKVITKAEQG